jgi:hypothetical protein
MGKKDKVFFLQLTYMLKPMFCQMVVQWQYHSKGILMHQFHLKDFRNPC